MWKIIEILIVILFIFFAWKIYGEYSGGYRKGKKPEVEKYWTTIYFGSRGSGKSLHQAKMCMNIFDYLDYVYEKYPKLHRSIVFSIQRFNNTVEEKHLVFDYQIKEIHDLDGKVMKVPDPTTKYLKNPVGNLYYWNDAKELRWCPRVVCWKGKKKHRLHHCYLIIDDMAAILPAGNWNNTPNWMIKMFSQARHFGIRILSNMQDPESVDINFRRYVDMAYRFRKVIGSPDPDETKPPIKHIWGFYVRRKIKAEILWKTGDISENEIRRLRAREKQIAEMEGRTMVSDFWKASPHWIGKKITSIYDTTQDVPVFEPIGFEHKELYCIDPKHNHTDKKAPNYCGYSKVYHNLV